MISIPTLFIVGAGASRELGLPLGNELAARIGDETAFARTSGQGINTRMSQLILGNSFSNDQEQVDKYIEAAKDISLNMPLAPSIDNFLHTHSHNKYIVEVGKVAIALLILAAERGSPLCHDSKQPAPFAWEKFRLEVPGSGRIPQYSTPWHVPFFRNLIEGAEAKDIDNVIENISFIIFNYDRCVEEFLYRSLRSYVRLSVDSAQDLIHRIPIYHPYGKLGRLPWQHGEDPAVDFGKDDPFANELIGLARNIRTFTERSDDEGILAQMREAVTSAERIVFLGFSFGQLNLDLIRPETHNNIGSILGTAYGISAYDQIYISRRIKKWAGKADGSGDVILDGDISCAALYGRYSEFFK